MKKYLTCLPVLAALMILNSCSRETIDNGTQSPDQLKTPEEINAYIKSQLSATGKFEWSSAPQDIVWSAVVQSDKVMSIGYKPEGYANVESNLHNIDISEASWKNAKAQLLQLIYNEEKKTDPSLKPENLEVFTEDVLPVIDVTVKNINTYKLLMASPLVRYAEPMGYEPGMPMGASAVASSSGCGSNNAEPGLMAGSDFTVISPNTKASWNYAYHNIQTAWTRSSGARIKVFVIDTGTSPDQDNLGSAFNQGSSSGRTIEKIVTLPRSTFLGIATGPVETPADGCGHGTSMAGAAAAPRGTDLAAVGVAYNCNLVTCRAAADVFLDESREVKGVADAFTNAGKRSDVRVISMSMGRLTSASQISDAIRYAYGRGKLIFCAAGTSLDWTAGITGVIFPANMNEVNAVTGIKDNLINRCDACHDGSQVDFTVVMQKSSGTAFPLTLAMSGNDPSTVGGSSVATATTAGIAALAWARFPTMTRDQLLNKLIQSSSNYPTKSTTQGWGRIDAARATN